MHYAVAFGLYEEVGQLLSLGANTVARNYAGMSVKDVAIEMADQVMIQMLGRRCAVNVFR
jgi:ankyrin repeat protein